MTSPEDADLLTVVEIYCLPTVHDPVLKITVFTFFHFYVVQLSQPPPLRTVWKAQRFCRPGALSREVAQS